MPRFVVLNSKFTNKNVSYVNGGESHQYLQTSGEDVGSPYAKFELEAAKSGGTNGALVNIRCCYNNKYWVLLPNSSRVVASADKPDEDVTKWSCTLFELVYVDVAKTTARFVHAHNLKYVFYDQLTVNIVFRGCLVTTMRTGFDTQREFEVIDWETLVIFPKHVTFKGDNGNYLGGAWIQGREHQQFEFTDIGNERLGYEIVPTPNRSVRIKSNFFGGKFWRRNSNWILADSTDTSTNNPDTLFLPTEAGNNSNVVALRNMGNNQFCKRLDVFLRNRCLDASDPTISQFARLVVEEHVLSRTIYNVVYRLTDSRIYNENILNMANGIATNTTTEPNTITITLTYTESSSTVWNASVSLSLGFTASMVKRIPKIGPVGFELSAEVSGEYAWGESQDTTQEVATEYTVTVPPMTRVMVSLLATRGTCDVPFSYSQRDTLFTGQHIIFAKDDGVFTGVNCFNFRYEATEEKL